MTPHLVLQVNQREYPLGNPAATRVSYQRLNLRQLRVSYRQATPHRHHLNNPRVSHHQGRVASPRAYLPSSRLHTQLVILLRSQVLVQQLNLHLFLVTTLRHSPLLSLVSIHRANLHPNRVVSLL